MINISPNCNWLGEQAKLNSSLIALEAGQTKLTYLELHEKVRERTQQLLTIGVSKNNIIGTLAGHSPQFVVDMFAVWNIGAILLPLNTKLSQNEINEQANFIGCRILENPKADDLPNNISFYGSEYSPGSSALLMFTSGSTGQNKAVQHTFKSLYSSALSIDEKFNFAPNEKWLASLPFYRIGGLKIIIRSILSGGTLCLPASINSKEIDEAVSRYKPDYLSLVNASLKTVVHNSELKSSKAIFVGGGPVDDKLLLEGIESNLPLYKVYGSTETGSMVTILDPTDAKKKPGSAGKPLNGNDVKIENDEVLVKSDSLFTGYYRNQEFTTEKLTSDWYYTGDTGFIDNEGYLFITGRIDNLIISGGEKINPQEIESELLKLDAIENAKVFGIRDDKWGEKVCAVVTTKRKINQSQIKKLLKETLPDYKVPKEIIEVDALPEDEMGKIDFEKLKKLFM